MMPITDFQIHHFRGFDHIRFAQCEQINLIVGRNNFGKSSILEALLLVAGSETNAAPVLCNQLRKALFSTASQIRFLFYEMDVAKHPRIEAYYNGVRKELILQALTSKETQSVEAVDLTTTFHQAAGGEQRYQQRVSLQERPKYSPDLFISSVYLPSYFDVDLLKCHLKLAIEQGKLAEIVESLQQFDPRIASLELLDEGVFVRLHHIQELLPIEFVGDGMRRFLSILSVLAHQGTRLLLIDEIDNGLHYTVMKHLWTSIFDYAQTYKVQLFITTHNMETLHSFKDVLTHDPTTQSKACLYSVVHTARKGFKTYRYTYQGITQALDNELEIRS